MVWGAQRGAKNAFLHVAEENTAAIGLDQQLGFEISYRHWYRIAKA